MNIDEKQKVESFKKLMQEVYDLETESSILENGIRTINQILKDKIHIDSQEVEELMFLFYIDEDLITEKGTFCEIGRLFLKHRDIILDNEKKDFYLNIANLLLILEENPNLVNNEKGLLELKAKAKKQLNKVERKKRKLLDKVSKLYGDLMKSKNLD